jgi:hypothetical protein
MPHLLAAPRLSRRLLATALQHLAACTRYQLVVCVARGRTLSAQVWGRARPHHTPNLWGALSPRPPQCAGTIAHTAPSSRIISYYLPKYSLCCLIVHQRMFLHMLHKLLHSHCLQLRMS